MNDKKSLAGIGAGQPNMLKTRRLGIDTQQEAVIFMRKDCHICRAEGFSAHSRIRLSNGKHSIIATLYQVTSDIIRHNEAGLSESAWKRLALSDGATESFDSRLWAQVGS